MRPRTNGANAPKAALALQPSVPSPALRGGGCVSPLSHGPRVCFRPLRRSPEVKARSLSRPSPAEAVPPRGRHPFLTPWTIADSLKHDIGSLCLSVKD